MTKKKHSSETESASPQGQASSMSVSPTESPSIPTQDISSLLATAVHAHGAGNLAEAEKGYREVLDISPDQPTALQYLGVIYAQHGDNLTAIETIQKAIELAPNNADAYGNLGKIYRSVGRIVDAENCYREGIKVAPDHAEPYYNLGNLLISQQKSAEAIEAFQNAVSLKPDFIQALFNLGKALNNDGRKEEALDAFQKAIEADPEYISAYHEACNLLKDFGKLEEAEAYLIKAQELGQTHHMNRETSVDHLCAQGNMLIKKGDFAEAKQAFFQAYELDPNTADAYNGLGIVHQKIGTNKDAMACLERAIALNPRHTGALSNLAISYAIEGNLAKAVELLKTALNINPNFVEGRINLATMYQDMGKLEESKQHLLKAIKTNSKVAPAHFQLSQVSKFSQFDEEAKTIQKLFDSPDTPESDKHFLGFALGKIYDDLKDYSSAIKYYGEGNAYRRKAIEYSIKDSELFFSSLREVFNTDFFERHQGTGMPDETPVFILGMPRSGTSLTEQILASHPQVFGAGESTRLEFVTNAQFGVSRIIEPANIKQVLQNIDEAKTNIINSAASAYVRSLRKIADDSAKVITDKMPHNFYWVGLIKVFFPNAKVVHCCRSPMDTCLSIYKQNFSTVGHQFAYDQTELGQYYRLYDALMHYWHETLPGFVYDLHYESLIADQEAQTRALLDFIGLDWDDACLQFHKTKRGVKTASFNQVNKPIYASSIEGWKKYGDALNPLREALGDLVSL